MSPTAERVNEVARLFLPLGAGVVFLILGILRGDVALLTLGGGAIGLPGLASMTRKDAAPVTGSTTVPAATPTETTTTTTTSETL